MASTMTVDLDDEMQSRLERLATTTQRSESLLAAEAIREYLDHHEWQVAEVQAALSEAEAGDFASDEDVAALAQRWQRHAP